MKTEMMKTVILATRNQGKVRELAAPLAAFGFAVRTPGPDSPDVEETGTTFSENALIKARALVEETGHPAVADDSGLVVDVLDGRPGVYSARYGADVPFRNERETEDERNIRKLLQELEPFTEPRTGRFCSAMAMVFPEPDKEDIVVEGFWEGLILGEPRGENGFGYDPVFFDPEVGKTAAELTREEKMARSHRAKALAKLLNALRQASV